MLGTTSRHLGEVALVPLEIYGNGRCGGEDKLEIDGQKSLW